jgi:hypothetical protein
VYGCSFAGSGTQLLVSVLYPRRALEDELASIRPLAADKGGGCGFEATLSDGTRVLYMAAPQPGRLRLNEVEATGEALLLSLPPAGAGRGIALGCSEFKVGRRKAAVPAADFEFALPADKSAAIAFTPIHKPLEMVEIAPAEDCFVDEIKMRLSHPERDVDIRYTLDGKDPTVGSKLYTEPITLKYSAIVKAKAFRKGVAETPTTFDNTRASAVARALFTKDRYRPPSTLNPTTQGASVAYYEGDWSLSAMFLDRVKAVKTGTAQELFDFSLKQTSNCYAFVYETFLDIPQDGVYNFHAPSEMIYPWSDAGYDLRVFLGGGGSGLDTEEWYPATRLHNYGVWSVPLRKGKHYLKVVFADQRPGKTQWSHSYPSDEPYKVWRGVKPALMISGPGLEKQPIPARLLYR